MRRGEQDWRVLVRLSAHEKRASRRELASHLVRNAACEPIVADERLTPAVVSQRLRPRAAGRDPRVRADAHTSAEVEDKYPSTRHSTHEPRMLASARVEAGGGWASVDVLPCTERRC